MISNDTMWGSCNTWMLDDWTVFGKNMDDFAKNMDNFEENMDEFARHWTMFRKTWTMKSEIVKHGLYFGRCM